MANITFHVPYDTRDFEIADPYTESYKVVMTSSKITVYWDSAHEYKTIFYGSFHISGEDVDGTVTKVEDYREGAKVYTASNLNYDVDTFLSYAAAGNARGFLTDVLKYNDAVTGSSGSDYLESFAGNDTIYGMGGNDKLYGGTGNDILDGGAGNDYMEGGAGNDTYYINSTGDSVYEAAGAGTDRVYASVSDTLDANVENLYLSGTAANGTGNTLNNSIQGTGNVNNLYGLAGNDTIYGMGGNDKLYGDTGNDTLDGGVGNDYMAGGAGNDTYYINSTGDSVYEAAGAGTDRAYASVSDTLDANVENLYLSGTAANGNGNTLNNIIQGTSKVNILSGLAGNDSLYGLVGNDTLKGGSGNDKIYGGTGNDVLYGGAGNDIVKGGAGQDRFVFLESGATNKDSISGFSHTDDTIVLKDILDGLDNDSIRGLSFNVSDVLTTTHYFEGAGKTGSGVHDASGIYNDTATGNIYYNPTGSTAGDSVLICTVGVSTAASLSNTDFVYSA
ncbi:Hemolysin-type calcium-binding repeat-containing protein [Syntrophus gentianae]|uniref:Hemolysin-type calcium-binding repeat-containing protein n=1 Tax=Syntrophus gentianae TaxID=43775 RepID=A0A1H7WN46_9BACT|nr:calcium-binding protein [Syntrophus gentianae]SEM23022.1 Hemolysin-type calcium-binding repeat-containing protein [Syntrophus gentianae]